MREGNENLKRITLVADIVAAYVSNNQIAPSELPGFIQLVHRSLCNAELGSPSFPPKRRESAVFIKGAVRSDHIMCFEDGKKNEDA